MKKGLKVQRMRPQRRQEVDTDEGHEDTNVIEEKGNITFVFVFASLAPKWYIHFNLI